MSLFGFLILHYGDIRVTEKCIGSIFELAESEKCRIMIIDNDRGVKAPLSERISKEYLSDDRVKVITVTEDAGFSRANNIGYKAIKEEWKLDYLIVANNDIVFEQTSFTQLIEKSRSEYTWDILSPDIVSADTGDHQSPIADRARTKKEINYTIRMNSICLKLLPVVYPIVRRMLAGAGERPYISDKKKDIVPCGACIILGGSFFEKEEELFAPETRFYYEEYILHARCQSKGYHILYDPAIKVVHGDGKATKKRSGNERARIKFMLKNTLESAKVYRKYIEDCNLFF